MRKLILEAEADRDIEEAHDWYEAQEAGVGVDFELKLNEAFNWIVRNPNLCREVRPKVRKHLMKVYPFAIFFKLGSDELRVFAVIHGSRDLGIIDRRLKP
jgi:plasmid stabilization system protein ParE